MEIKGLPPYEEYSFFQPKQALQAREIGVEQFQLNSIMKI